MTPPDAFCHKRTGMNLSKHAILRILRLPSDVFDIIESFLIYASNDVFADGDGAFCHVRDAHWSRQGLMFSLEMLQTESLCSGYHAFWGTCFTTSLKLPMVRSDKCTGTEATIAPRDVHSLRAKNGAVYTRCENTSTFENYEPWEHDRSPQIHKRQLKRRRPKNTSGKSVYK